MKPSLEKQKLILRRLRTVIAASVICSIVMLPAEASPVNGQKTPTVLLVEHFPFEGGGTSSTGGTDIDFSGRYVYAMQRGAFGGVHIFDAKEAMPKKLSFLHCPGDQNDVAVVRPGLIAIGYHSSECEGVEGGGIRLVDVSKPRKPRFSGAISLPPNGTHTLTTYPGEPLIYANTSTGQKIVDVSDPRKPEIVWSLESEGCHDLTFDIRKEQQLAFCPKGRTPITEVWDVSDPRAPEVLTVIVNPAIYYHHSAAVTSDGTHLVIGDEGFGVCTGASIAGIWIYDISDPMSPRQVTSWAPSNRAPGGSQDDLSRGCGTVHNFNMIPETSILVSAWMEGGTIIVDLSDPGAPKELAFYDDSNSTYWSAYYHRGNIYATDTSRGLDVLRLHGIRGRRT